MKLLIASRNTHKIDEIRAILSIPNVTLVGLQDVGDFPDVVEDGTTFQSNAIKKAMTIALQAKLWTLADDSGLAVDALNGEPGVYSARYAGEPVDYAANNTKLLKALDAQENRKAAFCCVVALCSPAGRAQIVEGRCEGRIINDCRGVKGFGYDPLFVPSGFGQTFAEMSASLKNDISHRAQALRAAKIAWGDMLQRECTDWPRRTLSSARN